MTGSVNGALYNVLYSLKVFVKHDSLTEFGEGQCITVPIRILERPSKIPEPWEEKKQSSDGKTVSVATNA